MICFIQKQTSVICKQTWYWWMTYKCKHIYVYTERQWKRSFVHFIYDSLVAICWERAVILAFLSCCFLFYAVSTVCVPSSFEPAHEIMALFVLRKLILQMRIRSHPVGLDVLLMVGPFVYFYTSCLRTAKALVRLRGCAGSPEPSLAAYVISTIISRAGSFGV